MKILVGLACVAIVAFVAYFFYGEWQAGQRAQQTAAARADLIAGQAEATRRLGAINSEGQDMATLCSRVVGWHAESEEAKKTFDGFMIDCRILGYAD